jgi:chemotaxis protein MotB
MNNLLQNLMKNHCIFLLIFFLSGSGVFAVDTKQPATEVKPSAKSVDDGRESTEEGKKEKETSGDTTKEEKKDAPKEEDGKEGPDDTAGQSADKYTPVPVKKVLLFYWKSEYYQLYDEYLGLVDKYNKKSQDMATINSKLGLSASSESQPTVDDAVKKIESMNARIAELEKTLAENEDTQKRSSDIDVENKKLRERVVELNDNLTQLKAKIEELEASTNKGEDKNGKNEKTNRCLDLTFSDKDVVLFETASHTLTTDGKKELNSVIRKIRKQSDSVKHITIIGHTDEVPVNKHKDVYLDNLELSIKRAASVFRYITSKLDIPLSQYTVAGRGENDPIVENAQDDAERSQNRRVDILIQLKD